MKSLTLFCKAVWIIYIRKLFENRCANYWTICGVRGFLNAWLYFVFPSSCAGRRKYEESRWGRATVGFREGRLQQRRSPRWKSGRILPCDRRWLLVSTLLQQPLFQLCRGSFPYRIPHQKMPIRWCPSEVSDEWWLWYMVCSVMLQSVNVFLTAWHDKVRWFWWQHLYFFTAPVTCVTSTWDVVSIFGHTTVP